MTAVSKVYNS